MSDPAIKLFGRTIALSETERPVEERTNPHPEEPIVMPPEVRQDTETVEGNETKDAKLENSKDLEVEDGSAVSAPKESHESSQPAQVLNEKTDPNSELPAEADAPSQEKVLKKPDKIIPCPRCNSMDTKFCYYNNYNVNQPRHFCKNCQRYWTAGGTMRNVPVGAGRRKNKHLSSHYRHLVVPSNGMQSVRVENSDSSCGHISPYGHSTPTSPFKGTKAVLMFGQEAPLCESMVNVLSLTEQKKIAEMSTMNVGGSTKKESSSVSMVAPSKCTGNGLSDKIPGPDKTDTPANPIHCYPGPPWAYPWNPVWNGVASLPAAQCTPEMVNGQKSCSSNPNPNANPIAWNIPPMISALPFPPPTMPYPFIPGPASYWGCMLSWPNGTWGAPWPGATASWSPSSSNSGSSSNHSTNLGKHSRDAASQVEEKAENSLWVPKTLRIDDPDEASKSSIWATLGIKLDRNEATVKGSMFKSFESKDKKEDNKDTAQVLHANPAALSRSFAFQEST